MQSCSSYSKMSTLESGSWPATGQPPTNKPDGWISWPLLNKSCCTSTRTRFSPHWIATLLGVTGCLNWKSTATSLCTSGTMGNLQNKFKFKFKFYLSHTRLYRDCITSSEMWEMWVQRLHWSLQLLLLLKTKRLLCKSSGVKILKLRNLLQSIPKPLRRKRRTSGSWIWLWLHASWTLTVPQTSPCILQVKGSNHNQH